MHFLTLLVLFCIACAGPVLNIIIDGPAFFVNRRATPVEILVFVGLVVFAVPALLWGVAAIGDRLSRRIGATLRASNVFLLSSAALMPAFAVLASDQGMFLVVLAVLGGAAFSALYVRAEWLKKVVLIFSPLAIIVPAQVVTKGELRQLIWPRSYTLKSGSGLSSTPKDVVVVVFDEFSLNALLTEDRQIDSVRFPNFAALAGQSVWLRNATAVNQFTPIAVPAILSGLFPKSQNQLPTAQQYPVNLFTLLSATHDIRALEPFTKLCPEESCPSNAVTASFWQQVLAMLADASAVYLAYAVPSELDLGNPEIDGKWGDFWREQTADWDAPSMDRSLRFSQYQDFIGGISKGDRPALYFMHMILPHMPFQFTPGGFSYRPGVVRLWERDHWIDNPALQQIAYSLYLSQVGTADRLLGTLIARLKAEGIWDDAIVVIAADHGVTFQPNAYRRGHPAHPSFYQDVMSVPFFLKLPGQISGEISDRNVETTDILPSIIEALGGVVDFPLDGRSVLSGHEPTEKSFFVGRIPGRVGAPREGARWGGDMAGETIRFPVPSSYPLDTIRWKHELPGYRHPVSANPLYIGPMPELLERAPQEFTQGPSSGLRYRIRTPGLKDGAFVFAPDSGACPCLVQGALSGETPLPGRTVAFALNGRIKALGHTFSLKNDPAEHFSFFVTERAFSPGRNTPELYEVRGGDPRSITLVKILQER